MELDRLIDQCQKELYLGYTSVEFSGLIWLNVSCKRFIIYKWK